MNGKGEEHRIVELTKAQQKRGMNWLIERAAIAYRINGKKLVTVIMSSSLNIFERSDVFNL